MTSGTVISVERLDIGAWAAAGRPAWESVVSRMPNASPFLSSVWTDSWIHVYAGQLEPAQIIVRDERGEALGTCLLTRRVRRRAVLPHVRVHLNTDGENSGDSVIIEHNALLAVPGAEPVVAKAIAGYVSAERIDEFRVSGATEDQVNQLSRALPGWAGDVEWHDAPFVNLERLRTAGQSHFDVISRNTREQLRRSLSRYERRGALVIRAAHTPSEAEGMFRELVQLHEARWRAVGHAGAFQSALRREFHQTFIERGFPMGHAQLLRITAGDDTVAILYNLVANGRVNFYQSGLACDTDKHLKPGMVAHHLAIQHCLAQCFTEYDFLSSAPGTGRYKASLADDHRRLAHLTLSRPGWRAEYFQGVRRLRHSASGLHRELRRVAAVMEGRP